MITLISSKLIQSKGSAREPFFCGHVAQQVERPAVNRLVVGSIPTMSANKVVSHIKEQRGGADA